jgi:hypothetical protein
MKKLTLIAACALSLAASAEDALLLTWDIADPQDKVQSYVLEHSNSASGPWEQIVIPTPATGFLVTNAAWFRRFWAISASNSFGLGPRTEPLRLPSAVLEFKAKITLTVVAGG